MDTKKSTLKKVLLFIAGVIITLFVILATIGIIHLNSVEKTAKAVAKIHSTKLTLDDVMGKNLPPDPGIEADKTIQGIDANKNNIRDDVELAIFKEYPNSAKTRAVLLQYALALQMEMTQDLVNKETVTEIITWISRADGCLADTLVPRKTSESFRDYDDVEKIQNYIDYVELKQFNNKKREDFRDSLYEKYLRSYTVPSVNVCDLDLSKL